MNILQESVCPELKLIARGKVRDLYEIDKDRVLFVATDRISAFDVIMKNGISGKGRVLTNISKFWFDFLDKYYGIKNHLITTNLLEMPLVVQKYKDQLQGRCMLVKKLEILPVEAIVRGYITGSAWVEYKKKRTICDIPVQDGLVECDALKKPLFTPSTKAEIGGHDENIHPSKRMHLTQSYPPLVTELIGEKYADKVQELSLRIYTAARDYAATRGIIIADTKFEFGVDNDGNVILADEVLTPDSSRFWPADQYTPGRAQQSFDKQYLRDYLASIGFDKITGIVIPDHVIFNTIQKYNDVEKILTNQE